MTLREAAEQALEALLIWEAMRRGTIDTATAVRTPAITALRDALAEPGWRQCAVGQKETQFCGLLEEAVEAAKDEAYSRGIDAGWALAQQSKAVQERNSGYTEEYAANVAAHARREEREACAKVCEDEKSDSWTGDEAWEMATRCAELIRARGNDDAA